MRALLLAAMCTGCIDASLTPCGTVACVSTQVCSPDLTCVSPDQLTACSGESDGAHCTFAASTGFCHHGACVEELGICGDGVARLALDELCDCGSPDVLATPPPGCSGFNSDKPGATCRADCKPAACGDGIVDTNELCDDGNTVPGDGCRADCQGRFTKMQSPTANILYAVTVVGPSEAYAFGRGGNIIHYDGIGWSPVMTTLNLTTDIIYAWSNGPDEVYAITADRVIIYDGSWKVVDPGLINLLQIWASSPTDIYTVSFNGLGGVVSHFDGQVWSTLTVPCSGASSVVGTGTNNVYIGGNTSLCRFNGLSWTMIDSTGVRVMAKGTGGDIATVQNTNPPTLRRWLGATPNNAVGIPFDLVSGITVTAIDEVHLTGGGGTVLQYHGGWSHLVTPTEVLLRAIGSSGPTNVMIVGDYGTVLH